MQRSVLVKLITIYLTVAFLLIGVLGFTIVTTYRRELVNQRIQNLTERAKTISSMLNDTLFVPSESVMLNMIRGIADEHDAAIQVADVKGNILMEITEKGQTVYNGSLTKQISSEIISQCLQGKII